jgi:hypothetical protein
MSLIKRIEGVFFNPKPVFAGLAEKPVWVDALVLLLVLLVIFTYLTYPFLQQDQVGIVKDNVQLKERMGEERFNQYVERAENPSPAARAVQIFAATPFFYTAFLLFHSLLILLLGRFVSTQGTYVQVLAALVHADFVNKLLGNAVRAVLAFTKKSMMQTSTGLALFFPKLEVTSTPYIILNSIDFFQLWLFGILGYGLSAVFKIDLKKALILSYAFWLLKTLGNIGLALVGMSFMR